MMKILSRETIKPSSPTLNHLKTYNLPLLDQVTPHIYIPMIFFYNKFNSTAEEKAIQLKKSLSQSLKWYYPFAGRFPTPTKPYVDCNDEGVVVLEAHIHRNLETFLDKVEQDQTLDLLFPNGLVWLSSSLNQDSMSTSPLAVQLNRFACGGFAVAVSMSHKIGDACTLATFMNHWAAVARCGSADHEEVLSINPHFISCPCTQTILPESPLNIGKNCITRKFVFPNSKIDEIKQKVVALAAGSINNPTRVEVLAALIHKCAVTAAMKVAGCFKPSGLSVAVNMRNKMVEKLPETTVGNIVSVIFVPTDNMGELRLNAIVSGLKNGKTGLERVRDLQEATEIYMSQLATFGDGVAESGAFDNFYFVSSLCGFPVYETDFGWGKPVGVSFRVGYAHKNSCFLMDTRDGDGIEALVILEREDMEVLQHDKELLAFC